MKDGFAIGRLSLSFFPWNQRRKGTSVSRQGPRDKRGAIRSKISLIRERRARDRWDDTSDFSKTEPRSWW